MAHETRETVEVYRVRGSRRSLWIGRSLLDGTYEYEERDAKASARSAGWGLTRADVDAHIDGMRADFPSLFRFA